MKKIYQQSGDYRIVIESTDTALLATLGRSGAYTIPGTYTDLTAAINLHADIVAALSTATTVAYTPPTDEDKWNTIRMQRDGLLAACDWRMTVDSYAAMLPAEQAAWEAYRQDLRDLPQDFEQLGPDAVVWPTAPDAA